MDESDNATFDLLTIKLVALKLKFNNFDTKSLSDQLRCFMINLDKLDDGLDKSPTVMVVETKEKQKTR